MKLALLCISLLLFGGLNLENLKSQTKQAISSSVSASASTSPSLNDVSAETTLKRAVQQWFTALSAEKGFEAWINAKWTSIPLGPGTHSWLIMIRKNELEVGYMIVGALEDGQHYRLIEYGQGNQPLYGLNTLYQSMIQQEIISSSTTFAQFITDASWRKERLDLGTLETFWKITHGGMDYYLDAKSGEPLLNYFAEELEANIKPSPIMKLKDLAASDQLTDLDGAQISLTSLNDAFDPFEKPSWVKDKPLPIHALNDLVSELKQHEKITFMSRIYQQKVIFPAAVTGYQQWNDGQVYISLDNEGSRYIPLSSLLDIGAFYS
jgi:hypothetical protein